jgi:hypothetical protein
MPNEIKGVPMRQSLSTGGTALCASVFGLTSNPYSTQALPVAP